MSKKVISVSANNNIRGFFDSYDKSEHRKIVEKTFDWSVNYLANLGIFDEVRFFADSDYADPELVRSTTHTQVCILPAHGKYFLRCNDEMLYEDTMRLDNDDYLFSTHMDAYISKQHIKQMLDDTNNHYLVGGTNSYHHDCLPVALDGKKVPWFADHYLICQAGWMRRWNLAFSWGPCFRPLQEEYLTLAGCPISIKGQPFLTMKDPSREYPQHGIGLSFDGFQEASLRIAINLRKGLMKETDIKEYPDGNRADRDLMHLKSFFMQGEKTWKGVSNNMIINTVILGRPPEKERFVGTEGNTYGHNPRLELEEIRGTSLYYDVWNDEERERFESLLA